MSDTFDVFGFELFQKLYHDELVKKEDVIILFVHWYLTKSGFKCYGIADGVDSCPLEKGSELLPKEWNLRQNYTLRYIRKKKMYILIGMKSDADLLLNLLKHHDNSVANMEFSIEGTVSMIHGDLETVIPSYQTVLNVIKKEFVDPICSADTSEATTQTSIPPTNIPSAYGVEYIPTMRNYDLPGNYRPDPLRVGIGVEVGRSDLHPPLGNPRGAGGGGMIYDPFSPRPAHTPGLGVPGRLPPAAIPPGARFDPFGPPSPYMDVRPRPHGLDDDHLPPPGYNDMFQ